METKEEEIKKSSRDTVEYLINSTDRTPPMESPKMEQSKKVRNTVGFLLTVVMLGLTAYVLYIQSENYKILELTADLNSNAHVHQAENYRHYVKEFSTTSQQLQETQTRLEKMTMELELVSKELDSTKSILSETEALLAQSQQENKILKGDPQAMANMQKLFGSQANTASKNIDTLKKQNETYDEELTKLRGDLNNYQVNVTDIKEAKSIIRELKNKIASVKEKMRALKRDAAAAREAAQKERDRQLTLLGNNGFVTRDGELQLTNKPKKTVDIDVKIVP